VSIWRDVTDRKQAEEALRESETRLQFLISSSPAVIYASKISGDYGNTYISENIRAVLGYEPREFMEDSSFWINHLHPDDAPRILAELPSVFEHGHHMYDYRFRHKDGSYRWMHDGFRLVYDANGQPKDIIGYWADITERKRAEEKLKEYSERLEEMVKERTRELHEAQEQLVRREKLAVLGQLAGGVGHELRNPLGVISNAVYYLKMVLSDADETTREYLEMISTEVGNSTKIVSGLLDFARTRPAEREEIGVSDLVAQVLEKHSPPEGVHVTTEVASDLPTVYVDPRQIEQVLTNLVTNAYQAMPEGGSLTISAKAEQNKVAVSVTDTGCGISPENLEKLFEPLFTTKARGIGLGLAVSKNLVETNGGSIEVVSEEGKGSTFTIILPTEEGVS
jgi:PAS domain S-box-containing protein